MRAIQSVLDIEMAQQMQQPTSVSFRMRWRWYVVAVPFLLALTIYTFLGALDLVGRPGASCRTLLSAWELLVGNGLLIAVLVHFAIQILAPGPVLQIGPAGICVRDSGRRLDLPWSRIASLGLWTGGAIGVQLVDPKQSRRWPSRFAAYVRRSTGMPPVLIQTGERSDGIEKIFDALETYGPAGLKIGRSRQGPSAMRILLSKSIILLLAVSMTLYFVSQYTLRVLICG